MKDGPTNRKTLGDVLELVRQNDYFHFRNRFIAIHVMLGLENALYASAPFLTDATAAYLKAWRDPLIIGDLSPLLLHPLEASEPSNPGSEIPSWLVGYDSFDGVEFRLGAERTPPLQLPTIKGAIAEVYLEVLGVVHTMYFSTLKDMGESEAIDWVLQRLISIVNKDGITRLVQTFLDTVDALFPVSDILMEPNDSASTKKELIASPIESNLLAGYTGAVDDEDRRLNFAQQILRRPKRDLVCEVKCPQCRSISLVRIHLQQTSRVGDMVFKIPGFTYRGSVWGRDESSG